MRTKKQRNCTAQQCMQLAQAPSCCTGPAGTDQQLQKHGLKSTPTGAQHPRRLLNFICAGTRAGAATAAPTTALKAPVAADAEEACCNGMPQTNTIQDTHR